MRQRNKHSYTHAYPPSPEIESCWALRAPPLPLSIFKKKSSHPLSSWLPSATPRNSQYFLGKYSKTPNRTCDFPITGHYSCELRLFSLLIKIFRQSSTEFVHINSKNLRPTFPFPLAESFKKKPNVETLFRILLPPANTKPRFSEIRCGYYSETCRMKTIHKHTWNLMWLSLETRPEPLLWVTMRLLRSTPEDLFVAKSPEKGLQELLKTHCGDNSMGVASRGGGEIAITKSL